MCDYFVGSKHIRLQSLAHVTITDHTITPSKSPHHPWFTEPSLRGVGDGAGALHFSYHRFVSVVRTQKYVSKQFLPQT
jgi:hypothetical protein